MIRSVAKAGLLGGVVAILWTIVGLSLIPLRDSMGWKEVPDEARVLEVLDSGLPQTGLYLVPGHAPPDSLFRARHSDGPLFRVHSLRNGTEGPIRAVISILALLVSPLVPAWILFTICRCQSPTYAARVLVVALFGLFVSLTSDIQLWGMELYPMPYSLLLMANSTVTWILVGFVLAWRIKPNTKVQSGEV